jgi:hypothetical protein
MPKDYVWRTSRHVTALSSRRNFNTQIALNNRRGSKRAVTVPLPTHRADLPPQCSDCTVQRTVAQSAAARSHVIGGREA